MIPFNVLLGFPFESIKSELSEVLSFIPKKKQFGEHFNMEALEGARMQKMCFTTVFHGTEYEERTPRLEKLRHVQRS